MAVCIVHQTNPVIYGIFSWKLRKKHVKVNLFLSVWSFFLDYLHLNQGLYLLFALAAVLYCCSCFCFVKQILLIICTSNLWLSVYLSEVWYAIMCKNYREERCNWITIIGCVKVLITHQIQLFDMTVWNVWKVFGLTLSFVKVSRQTNHQKHEE